jgi:hypothetical protein
MSSKIDRLAGSVESANWLRSRATPAPSKRRIFMFSLPPFLRQEGPVFRPEADAGKIVIPGADCGPFGGCGLG